MRSRLPSTIFEESTFPHLLQSSDIESEFEEEAAFEETLSSAGGLEGELIVFSDLLEIVGVEEEEEEIVLSSSYGSKEEEAEGRGGEGYGGGAGYLGGEEAETEAEGGENE